MVGKSRQSHEPLEHACIHRHTPIAANHRLGPSALPPLPGLASTLGMRGFALAMLPRRFFADAWTGRQRARGRVAEGTPSGRGSDAALTTRCDLVDVGLEHETTLQDLPQHVMHLVIVKDQVEFAHILECPIERLDEYLDEVEDAQLRLGVVHDEPAYERRSVEADSNAGGQWMVDGSGRSSTHTKYRVA